LFDVAHEHSAAAAKTALRDQILTARNRRSLLDLREDAEAIAAHLLDSLPVRRAATVAAYVSVGREPGTGPLLDRLRAAGKRVVVPVLLGDNDLDWAEYVGPDALVSGGRGTLEPVGRRLGPDSIGTADVVVTPGLAVSADGHRLGRGGGSYDRALGRVPLGTFTCTLLYEGEWPVDVPLDPHDRPVTAVVTPRGISPCRPPRRA
jgi:5-formyltetrahydrofolate cyclo-ligase